MGLDLGWVRTMPVGYSRVQVQFPVTAELWYPVGYNQNQRTLYDALFAVVVGDQVTKFVRAHAVCSDGLLWYG